jgi:hypothetical protein
MSRTLWLASVCLFLVPRAGLAQPAEAKAADAKAADKVKEIAGKSEFLRSVPKRFARLLAVDAVQRNVTLLIEGESLPKVWPLLTDAEVKVMGWWGRLDQFRPEDRVWVWFYTNRSKQPVAILMLADEISEQDIHGAGLTLESRTSDTLTLKPVLGPSRTVKAAGAEVYKGKERLRGENAHEQLPAGTAVYVQTRGEQARLVLDAEAFALGRAAQQALLRQRWTRDGLPGTVVFLHQFTGEMDYMLDHEAMRWGRALRPGDTVTLATANPIKAVVKQVRPWRERTQLRLVTAAADQGDLAPGQRVPLKVTPAAAEVDPASLPPDLDRPRSRDERID